MFQTVVELKSSAAFCGNECGLSAAKAVAFNRSNTLQTKPRRRKVLIVPILLIIPLLLLMVVGAGGRFVQRQQFRLLQQKCPALQQMGAKRLDVLLQRTQRILLVA